LLLNKPTTINANVKHKANGLFLKSASENGTGFMLYKKSRPLGSSFYDK
jgi:hypothetical protein